MTQDDLKIARFARRDQAEAYALDILCVGYRVLWVGPSPRSADHPYAVEYVDER